jgi:signal transduction histidine kinase
MPDNDLLHLTSAIAHDMGAPVRHIQAFTGMLKKSLELTPKQEKLFGYVEVSVEKLALQLRDVARYGDLERPRDLASIDVDRALEVALAKAHARIGDAVIDAADLGSVRNRPDHIGCLVQELVTNAATFRRETCCIRVRTSTQDGLWRLEVDDNGIGIREDAGDAVFDMWRQLHKEDTYPGRGTGLALCQRIATLHGGRIGHQSLEPGTRVWVELPVYQEP